MALYLNRKLGFDVNDSTALYHSYEFLIYFFVIFGAIIAESWLGLFKTIASVTLVYSVGAALVSIAAIEMIDMPVM